MTGHVMVFARLEPAYVRLIGPVGADIKEAITITREKDHPFRVVEVRAKNGKDIAFELKEFNEIARDGYVLTVENRKTMAGRYADAVILTTDSTIKPTLTVPVYGQITSPAPATEPVTPPRQKGGE